MDSNEPSQGPPLKDSPAEENLDCDPLNNAYPPLRGLTDSSCLKDHDDYQMFLNIKTTPFPTTPLGREFGSYRASTGVRELDEITWRVPDKSGALISRSIYAYFRHGETKNWACLKREDGGGLKTVINELMKEVAYIGWYLNPPMCETHN